LNFSATIRQVEQVSLVDLRGQLTSFEVGVLRDAIRRLLDGGHKNFVLNLSELSYLDSSGIGELARLYAAVVKRGGALKVVGLTSRVQEVFKITQLYQVFPEFPDEQAALQSFPRNRNRSSS
jgi:anti-sigma B factor antagonist